MPTFTPTGQACGALVTDLDLRRPLDPAEAAALRAGLDEHHVLAFPDQPMSDADLERFSEYFGDLGTDPWFRPIEGSDYVAELRRDADETTSLFAEGWHSDWSFLATPPLATCLAALTIPPVGGDTLFANQHLAYERLPAELKERLDGLVAFHTTEGICGRGGVYDGESEGEQGRGIDIVTEGDPMTGEHPLVRIHEGNGRPALFSTLGYVRRVVGMDADESRELLAELHRHQTAPDVIYTHRWEPDMCVIWDNRSVIHRATGGYEGHARVLHRTTVVPRAAAA